MKIKNTIAIFCALLFVMLTPACTFGVNNGQDSGENNCSFEIITDQESGITYAYFGNYPQREVVSLSSESGVFGKDWASEDDYIVDANIYNTLKILSDDKWNTYGDTIIGEDKYRRIKADNATYSEAGNANYYDWTAIDVYHYFKYEPIKWRVLKQSDNEAFLLSEVVLDDQKYNTKITNMTWETSTIRSWLNGYDSTANLYGTDYSDNNFINTAFTAKEQSKIKNSTVENKDNIKNGTEGGNDTTDKIFLLSEDELYNNATEYGFESNYNASDTKRQSKSSTYAKAMGAFADCESDSLGNCDWWSRSPGSYTGLFILVMSSGRVYRGGQHANSSTRGVRPALYVSL